MTSPTDLLNLMGEYQEGRARKDWPPQDDMSDSPPDKLCPTCGARFIPSTPETRTCSYSCGQRMRYGSVESRFWARVNKRGPDDCWPWSGLKLEKGYGRLWVHGKNVFAHRIAYELENGSIDPDLMVLHSCEDRYPAGDISSRACCNPAHLSQGTQVENIRQRDERGRAAAGDRNGSRLHPEKRPRGDTHWSRINPEKRPRGEAKPMSRLKRADVLQIRSRFGKGELSQTALAAEYGVSQPTISAVILRKAWSHVP